MQVMIRAIPVVLFFAGTFLFGSVHAAAPDTSDALKAGIAEASKKYGGCDSDPFPFLEQRHRGDRTNSFVTPTQDGKRGLDTALACRLKKLLEAAESKGCRLTINSAMRPTQRCNPNGGACARQGNSCHQYGRAVDLGGSSQCLAWITQVIGRKNANSPFKLHVAYQENGNYRHVQCSEHIIANASAGNGCRSACNGGISINPDLSSLPGTPTADLTNQLRNIFNPQQPQQEQMCALPGGGQVPCSAIANRGSQQPLPQQQQPGQLGQQPPALGSDNTTAYAPGTCPPQFYCKNDTYYYRSSTCVDQVQKKCPAGCSNAGTTCAATSTSETSSAFDQIESIAEPAAEEVGFVSDKILELAIRDEDIATLGDDTRPTTTIQTDDSNIPQTPLSDQTFISGDLRHSPAEQYPPQELSAMQRVLATMKDTLLRVLSYLRPFGRQAIENEDHEESIE